MHALPLGLSCGSPLHSQYGIVDMPLPLPLPEPPFRDPPSELLRLGTPAPVELPPLREGPPRFLEE